jgi:hypothetical protein
MRILLLGETGREPGFEAWSTSLTRAGVPFDAIALAERRAPMSITTQSGIVYYQALILTQEGLIDSALDAEQRAALERLEHELGLRRLTAYAYPSARYGLTPPTWAGRLDGLTASLTAQGLELFPYLRGSLPIDDGTWGYFAGPDSAQDFETLLVGPDGASLLGIHRDGDGREQMVQTFDANSAQLHGQLLRQGQLSWLTRGAYLGFQRNYLTLEVDDILLPNNRWDPERHTTDLGTARTVRMTAEDAVRTANWSRARGLRLDLACNGAGSQRYALECGGDRDPLLDALLSERATFGWVNHTFEHRNLDDASRVAIETEIESNLIWAEEHGIEFEPHVLITGEHTGLADLIASPPRAENQELGPALTATEIHFLACDASRPYPSGRSEPSEGPLPAGTPFAIGSALAIPRYPTALAHDVATQDQVLDRLRSTGRMSAESWTDVVRAEARRIFAKVVGNDPRPHYFHQSNLVAARMGGNGSSSSLLCELLDAVLNLYQSLILPSMPICQPTLTEIGRTFLGLETWRRASGSGRLRAWLEGREVTIVNNAGSALAVPMTGTSIGQEYGGSRSAWVSVPPGKTVFQRDPNG